MVNIWTNRWVEAHDNCIVYYDECKSGPIEGILRLDSGLTITSIGRYLIIQTNSRKLTLYASSEQAALVWRDSLIEFYAVQQRSKPQPYQSSFPIRQHVEILQIFTCSRDYYFHVARSLLMAKEEILISAWKLSPMVLLTRSPLPPLRLDQILKYKADQGVKVYILLYQEVGDRYFVFFHSLG
jgi:phosphatidylserine/phosphatidylglycerophosphate/cardiolipin synthase-like enzyme